MNNILVVNINWLGDAVFSIPVFKALKKTYPQARITCLCLPRVREVLEFCPYVDKIITYDEQIKLGLTYKILTKPVSENITSLKPNEIFAFKQNDIKILPHSLFVCFV